MNYLRNSSLYYAFLRLFPRVRLSFGLLDTLGFVYLVGAPIHFHFEYSERIASDWFCKLVEDDNYVYLSRQGFGYFRNIPFLNPVGCPEIRLVNKRK